MFHVLNRAVEGATLFRKGRDYDVFLHRLTDTLRRIPMRLLAYAVMPNHWHLVLWPSEDNLSKFMKRLTAAHAQKWREQHGSRGRGAVYQGRFKAIAVQRDGHLIQLCRYVERNPVRARLVGSVQDWPWSSASLESADPRRPPLTAWPVRRPRQWLAMLNAPEPTASLARVRGAIRESRHFGASAWRLQVSGELRWRQGGRGPGRTWERPVLAEDEVCDALSDDLVRNRESRR
ncbi:MAG: transposase [Vicinamibacterales bacterium]|nr:transposase [Vicinamibacterales bacterium]